MPQSLCHSCLSRRECLKLVSAAALGACLDGGALRRAAVIPRDRVDPATLRPQPSVRIAAAILRMPPPYWLGWPGTTYDLEGHQREYLGKLEESARRLSLTTEVVAAPVQDAAGMDALVRRVREQRPDGLLVILQHLSCWRWVDRLSHEAGVPLLVFAPIGTAFTGHVRDVSRRSAVHVVSSLEWSAVEAGLRMVRAKRMFEASRILWIRGAERNETVVDRLGSKVRALPRRTFHELFAEMPADDEVHEVATALQKAARAIVEPSVEDLRNSARCYTTAKRLLAEHHAHALSMDCLGMVEARLVPTPPCGAWTLLQDQGVTAGCEADLFGALSLMLSSYLLERPGFINDPVPDTARNLLVAAHCTCGTRLRGFAAPPVPYVLRDHSESSLGVSLQVLWPPGEPVTLLRFQSSQELIVDRGSVVDNVDTPPAGGCRTSVSIRMDGVEDVRDVLGFHQVVVLGDHRREVEAFAQLYGIETLRSGRKTG